MDWPERANNCHDVAQRRLCLLVFVCAEGEAGDSQLDQGEDNSFEMKCAIQPEIPAAGTAKLWLRLLD